jgi:hypothetical protein
MSVGVLVDCFAGIAPAINEMMLDFAELDFIECSRTARGRAVTTQAMAERRGTLRIRSPRPRSQRLLNLVNFEQLVASNSCASSVGGRRSSIFAAVDNGALLAAVATLSVEAVEVTYKRQPIILCGLNCSLSNTQGSPQSGWRRVMILLSNAHAFEQTGG